MMAFRVCCDSEDIGLQSRQEALPQPDLKSQTFSTVLLDAAWQESSVYTDMRSDKTAAPWSNSYGSFRKLGIPYYNKDPTI